MSKHLVETRWKGGMQFESTNPGGNLMIDAGPENGGLGAGYRPKMLMLSALAGCSGLDIAHLIPKMKLSVRDFSIDTEGILSESEPQTYTAVTLYYRFYGEALDQNKLQRAVDLSVEKYCGVLEMFRSFATVKIVTEFHP